jgi:hypothetical protein
LWSDPELLELKARTEDEPKFLLIGQIEDLHWSAVVGFPFSAAERQKCTVMNFLIESEINQV